MESAPWPIGLTVTPPPNFLQPVLDAVADLRTLIIEKDTAVTGAIEQINANLDNIQGDIVGLTGEVTRTRDEAAAAAADYERRLQAALAEHPDVAAAVNAAIEEERAKFAEATAASNDALDALAARTRALADLTADPTPTPDPVPAEPDPVPAEPELPPVPTDDGDPTVPDPQPETPSDPTPEPTPDVPVDTPTEPAEPTTDPTPVDPTPVDEPTTDPVTPTQPDADTTGNPPPDQNTPTDPDAGVDSAVPDPTEDQTTIVVNPGNNPAPPVTGLPG